MALEATAGALLVGPVCSREHDCGFHSTLNNRNRGEIVPAFVGTESCWLTTGHSEI